MTTGCAAIPRAVRPGRPPGSGRFYPATEVCGAGPGWRMSRAAEAGVAAVSSGTPARSGRKSREGVADALPMTRQ